MIAVQRINWQPFSDKHKRYINNAEYNKLNVAEGAIRSGKTIDNCIIFRNYLETCPDRIHLASGSTIGNAKLNIGDCNGYGLEYLFRGRCRWGKHKDNEALFVITPTGEKIIIFAGGGKSDSFRRILGNSYGGWMATEINEHYDCDDSRYSFIKVALGRQAAATRPKILWDLNPCNPRHPIYSEYIDKYIDNFEGGYQYEHFTMADNLAITDERRRELESIYTPGTAWHSRDILGLRTVAEGLVYRIFADNTARYMLDDEQLKQWAANVASINIGVDFGGNGSGSAFITAGFTSDYKTAIVLDEEFRLAATESPDSLGKAFAAYVQRTYDKFGLYPRVYADSAEQLLITGLREAINKLPIGRNILIRNARKEKINDRIHFINHIMGQDRFLIYKGCKETIDAMCVATYDPKADIDIRLDDGSYCMDVIDAMEYALEPHIKRMYKRDRFIGDEKGDKKDEH